MLVFFCCCWSVCSRSDVPTPCFCLGIFSLCAIAERRPVTGRSKMMAICKSPNADKRNEMDEDRHRHDAVTDCHSVVVRLLFIFWFCWNYSDITFVDRSWDLTSGTVNDRQPPHLTRPFTVRFLSLRVCLFWLLMFISNTKCVNINWCYTILLPLFLHRHSSSSIFGLASGRRSVRVHLNLRIQTHTIIIIIIQIRFILERQHHSITWWFCLFFVISIPVTSRLRCAEENKTKRTTTKKEKTT